MTTTLNQVLTLAGEQRLTKKVEREDPAQVVVEGGREVPVVKTETCPRCHNRRNFAAILKPSGNQRKCMHCGLRWFTYHARAVAKFTLRWGWAQTNFRQAALWYRNDAIGRYYRALQRQMEEEIA